MTSAIAPSTMIARRSARATPRRAWRSCAIPPSVCCASRGPATSPPRSGPAPGKSARRCGSSGCNPLAACAPAAPSHARARPPSVLTTRPPPRFVPSGRLRRLAPPELIPAATSCPASPGRRTSDNDGTRVGGLAGPVAPIVHAFFLVGPRAGPAILAWSDAGGPRDIHAQGKGQRRKESPVINFEARMQPMPGSRVSQPKFGSMLPQAERCRA